MPYQATYANNVFPIKLNCSEKEAQKFIDNYLDQYADALEEEDMVVRNDLFSLYHSFNAKDRFNFSVCIEGDVQYYADDMINAFLVKCADFSEPVGFIFDEDFEGKKSYYLKIWDEDKNANFICAGAALEYVANLLKDGKIKPDDLPV